MAGVFKIFIKIFSFAVRATGKSPGLEPQSRAKSGFCRELKYGAVT